MGDLVVASVYSFIFLFFLIINSDSCSPPYEVLPYVSSFCKTSDTDIFLANIAPPMNDTSQSEIVKVLFDFSSKSIYSAPSPPPECVDDGDLSLPLDYCGKREALKDGRNEKKCLQSFNTSADFSPTGENFTNGSSLWFVTVRLTDFVSGNTTSRECIVETVSENLYFWWFSSSMNGAFVYTNAGRAYFLPFDPNIQDCIEVTIAGEYSRQEGPTVGANDHYWNWAFDPFGQELQVYDLEGLVFFPVMCCICYSGEFFRYLNLTAQNGSSLTLARIGGSLSYLVDTRTHRFVTIPTYGTYDQTLTATVFNYLHLQEEISFTYSRGLIRDLFYGVDPNCSEICPLGCPAPSYWVCASNGQKYCTVCDVECLGLQVVNCSNQSSTQTADDCSSLCGIGCPAPEHQPCASDGNQYCSECWIDCLGLEVVNCSDCSRCGIGCPAPEYQPCASDGNSYCNDCEILCRGLEVVTDEPGCVSAAPLPKFFSLFPLLVSFF